MMQNAVNESFWDAHGVEIGPCANFDPKTFFGGVAKKMAGLILWGLRHHYKVKNVFCLKLDAKSVPEALATPIRILLRFSIVLAHRHGTMARARQLAREHLLTTPGHPP